VINSDAQDITPNDDADSLLAEIAKGASSDPTVPAPPSEAEGVPSVVLHTIPHESPLEKSIPESIPSDQEISESGELPPSKDDLENVSY
jgi:hypothetical protein